MNNDEQIEEHKLSFYSFILEEDNNELKKNDVKGKYNFVLVCIGKTNICNKINALI